MARGMVPHSGYNNPPAGDDDSMDMQSQAPADAGSGQGSMVTCPSCGESLKLSTAEAGDDASPMPTSGKMDMSALASKL